MNLAHKTTQQNAKTNTFESQIRSSLETFRSVSRDERLAMISHIDGFLDQLEPLHRCFWLDVRYLLEAMNAVRCQFTQAADLDTMNTIYHGGNSNFPR